MEKCLVLRLNAVVENENLPYFNSMKASFTNDENAQVFLASLEGNSKIKLTNGATIDGTSEYSLPIQKSNDISNYTRVLHCVTGATMLITEVQDITMLDFHTNKTSISAKLSDMQDFINLTRFWAYRTNLTGDAKEWLNSLASQGKLGYMEFIASSKMSNIPTGIVSSWKDSNDNGGVIFDSGFKDGWYVKSFVSRGVWKYYDSDGNDITDSVAV